MAHARWLQASSIMMLACGLAAAPAAGQPAPASAETEAVEEIIVTAQRREERLQDVPISLSVLSGGELDDRRVDNIHGLLSVVPSVSFTTTGGNEARTDFSIRGVANQGGATSPFALYIDEVSFVFSGVGPQLGSVRGFDANLLDVERAEVLRGPQGTYFGRNALGGAVNIVTRKPGPDLGGYVSADLSLDGVSRLNGEGVLVKAGVNLPVGETLAVRANGYAERAAGWIRDLGPADNTNDRRSYGGRVAARWQPSEQATLDVTALHSLRKRGINSDIPSGMGLLGLSCRVNSMTGLTACPLGALAVPGAPIDSGQGFWPTNKDRIATDFASRGRNRTSAATARFAYAFEPVDLTIVGGWVNNRAYDGGDVDYTPLDYLRSDRTNTARGENFSIEARLASVARSAGPLRWTVGINAADETGGRGLSANWGTSTFVPPPFRGRLFARLDAEIETRSLAAFGEASLEPVANLTVTGGLRYSRDDVKTTSASSTETLGAGLNVPAFSVSQEFDDLSPKLNVTYRWSPRVMTYATVSKGYKAGGFNPGLGATAANTPSYSPETLWNYEIGLKSELLDRRLRLNASAYLMDWNDIQVSVFDAQRIANVVSNASGARVKGIEIDAALRPGRLTTLGLTYSYNDSRYRSFERCLTLQTTTTPIFIDCSGRRFGNKHILGATAEQRFELGAAELFLRGEYSWRSKLVKIDDIPETTDPRSAPFTIGAYDTVNLRLGVEQGPWRAEIYGENIIGSVPAIGDRELFAFITGEQVTPRARRVGLRVMRSF